MAKSSTATNTSEIIQVTNLVKKFGDFTAVNGISFSVEQGEIFGILGPNGAGRSAKMNQFLINLLNLDFISK